MGHEKAFFGRQGHSAVWPVSWLRPGREREPYHQRGTGKDCAENLRPFPAGAFSLPDRKNTDGGRHPDAGRQKGMGQSSGAEHPDQ